MTVGHDCALRARRRKNFCAARFGVLDEGVDAVDGGHADNGSEDDFTFSGIAARQSCHLGNKFLSESVGHFFVDDDALGRHADLSLVHEGSEGGGIDGGVEVGIIENNERSFAAEFEKNRLECRAAATGDEFPNSG